MAGKKFSSHRFAKKLSTVTPMILAASKITLPISNRRLNLTWSFVDLNIGRKSIHSSVYAARMSML